MNTTVENLRDLAGRLQRGDPQAWSCLQQELQPGLIPIVRRALRTGTGSAALTRFLDRALLTAPREDSAETEDVLARMLCHGLARQFGPQPGRVAIPSAETVVNGGGNLDSATRA